MRTKWEILEERRQEFARKAWEIQKDFAWCADTPLEIPCTGCGKVLMTELDFMQHFIIPDERYLNLGECPDKV